LLHRNCKRLESTLRFRHLLERWIGLEFRTLKSTLTKAFRIVQDGTERFKRNAQSYT